MNNEHFFKAVSLFYGLSDNWSALIGFDVVANRKVQHENMSIDCGVGANEQDTVSKAPHLHNKTILNVDSIEVVMKMIACDALLNFANRERLLGWLNSKCNPLMPGDH